MKVSLSWLSEYIDLQMTAAELTAALTMAGLEVDSVTDRYDDLATVVVARILEVRPHPKADKLKLCRVDIGQKQIDIVCGAPNAAKDIIVPCALPGTLLSNGAAVESQVIRGETSEGMLCSQAELGLGKNQAGLMLLDTTLAPGSPLPEALGLSDPVLEIDLTPNRPDCLSITGIAREVAAIQHSPLHLPEVPEITEPPDAVADLTSVNIQAPDLCPRYAARLVFDLQVGPSPDWLQHRLLSLGLRPINNVVDATNFVMMELGQPLHAFDFDLLDENRIVVRAAEAGERFVTLDEKERLLDAGMLLICDGKKPVALAGVMGGLNSEINDKTTRVLIESAYFLPASIRQTAKKVGLGTDASHRFERGVDPQGTVVALERCARLMAEISGGRIIEGVIDAHPKPSESKTIQLSVSRTNTLLGTALNRDQMTMYLESIAFEVRPVETDLLEVRPPSFRVDVTRPEDLMEEIARRSGYNQIPTTFPMIEPTFEQVPEKLALRNEIKDIMHGLGFNEAITYSFIGAKACDQLRLQTDDRRRNLVHIMNPLTEDQAVLRTSLIPGLLEVMNHNISRQIRTVKLFEIGKTFLNTQVNQQPEETEYLTAIWSGNRTALSWHGKETPCDFYDLKGAAEALFLGLRIPDVSFTVLPRAQCRYTRPGHSAQIRIAGRFAGLIGELHPRVLANFGLKQTGYVFELNVDAVTPETRRIKKAGAIPKYPAVSRDITLIIDQNVATNGIIDHIQGLGEKLVEDIVLFDVYQGEPIPEGKKSISLRLTYRSQEKTLEDEWVNQLHSQLTDKVIQAFQAMLPA